MCQWMVGGQGTGEDVAQALAVDGYDRVYVGGYFSSQHLIVEDRNLTNHGIADIFLMKFDAGGNLIWAQNPGGSDYEEATALVVDTWKGIRMTGGFRSDPLWFGNHFVVNAGPVTTADGFIAFLNASAGIQEFSGQEKIRVFPNPTADRFTLEFEPVYDKLVVYNSLGEVIVEHGIQGKSFLQLELAVRGFYFLCFSSGQQQQQAKLMVR